MNGNKTLTEVEIWMADKPFHLTSYRRETVSMEVEKVLPLSDSVPRLETQAGQLELGLMCRKCASMCEVLGSVPSTTKNKWASRQQTFCPFYLFLASWSVHPQHSSSEEPFKFKRKSRLCNSGLQPFCDKSPRLNAYHFRCVSVHLCACVWH